MYAIKKIIEIKNSSITKCVHFFNNYCQSIKIIKNSKMLFFIHSGMSYYKSRFYYQDEIIEKKPNSSDLNTNIINL